MIPNKKYLRAVRIESEHAMSDARDMLSSSALADSPAQRLLIKRFDLKPVNYRHRKQLLNERGLNALENMTFSHDARKFMAGKGKNEDQVRRDFLMDMSLTDVQNFNRMPSGIKLHVVARKRPDPKTLIEQTKIYNAHRPEYIKFIGRHFGDQLQNVGMDQGEIQGMSRYGVLPVPWTVEHIRPKGADRGVVYPDEKRRNTFGNLILMQSDSNYWNNELELSQIARKGKHFADLIVSARPEYGPEECVVVHGSSLKAQIPQAVLKKLAWTEISDLPSFIPFSGPSVPLSQSQRRNAPKATTKQENFHV